MLNFRYKGQHDGRGPSGYVDGRYSPERFAIGYRKLQILVVELNSLLKWALWGLLNAFIFTAVFGTCGAVWGEGGRKIHVGSLAMFMTALIVIIYSKLASLYEVSEDVLRGWNRAKGSSAWFPRFLKSTRPLKVLLGSYFYADKKLVLTSLGIIADNSVTLLVSRRS